MMDGSKYKGVLSRIDGREIVLRLAHLVFDGLNEVKFAKPEDTKVVASSVWKMIEATEVKIGAADLGPVGAMDDAGGFGTDAAISRGKGGEEGRTLERWSVDAGGKIEGGLEDMDVRSGRGWDQFALNEARFGVKTDYKEELYTTELDYSKSKISIEEANRIAAEIEKGSSSTTNIHLLEERGVDVDDIDEEARYGAVIRDSGPKQNNASKSIPINARKEANKVRAHMTSSKTSSPYGTPKLESPLVGDAKFLEALNLDPGAAKIDDETRKQFEAFKLHSSKKQAEAKSGEKPKSTLNPNAKSFTFNVNAKEFNPGSFAPSQRPRETAPPPPPPPEGMPPGSAVPGMVGHPMPFQVPPGGGAVPYYQPYPMQGYGYASRPIMISVAHPSNPMLQQQVYLPHMEGAPDAKGRRPRDS